MTGGPIPIAGRRLKVGVLVSGGGSNLQALLDACADPAFPAEIVLVLSNKAEAGGLDRARRAGVAAVAVSHRDYPDRGSFEAAMQEVLLAHEVEFVCLAGFMRVLTADFVERWNGRMLNIHPSLLPSFKGLHTHAQALAAGVRFHGCTVHFVKPALDDGPIVAQASVPVLPGDDENSLAARVLTAEHRIYPLALKLVASGDATVEANAVRLRDPTSTAAIQLNPSDE